MYVQFLGWFTPLPEKGVTLRPYERGGRAIFKPLQKYRYIRFYRRKRLHFHTGETVYVNRLKNWTCMLLYGGKKLHFHTWRVLQYTVN
jgi:hypothetical protein